MNRAAATVILLFCGALILGCRGFNDQLLFNKATRLHDAGKIDAAIVIYKYLLDSDPDNKVHPDNAIVAYDLGMAYLDIGKRQKAKEQVDLLRRIKRDDLAKVLEGAMKSQEL